MSVYRDTNASVVFTHPVAGPLSATVYRDGQVILTVSNITKINNQFTISLTYDQTEYDGNLSIVWSDGASFSRTQVVDVVTPIVSLDKLRTLYTDSNPTDDELSELEGTVRTAVKAYCRQSFGWSYGPRTYIGNGSGKLILKEHCDKLDGILGVYGGYDSTYIAPDGSTNEIGQLNLDRAGVIEDGWSVLINFPTYLDVKQSPPMELISSAPAQDGTIRVPRRLTRLYDSGTQYTLTGEWGYAMIPDEVEEAALILASAYMNNDEGYRDRYLEIIKIQQDSFTYHPGAFRGTGNARADMLLGEYRRTSGMIVI